MEKPIITNRVHIERLTIDKIFRGCQMFKIKKICSVEPHTFSNSIINDLKPDKRIVAVPVSFGVAFESFIT